MKDYDFDYSMCVFTDNYDNQYMKRKRLRMHFEAMWLSDNLTESMTSGIYSCCIYFGRDKTKLCIYREINDEIKYGKIPSIYTNESVVVDFFFKAVTGEYGIRI